MLNRHFLCLIVLTCFAPLAAAATFTLETRHVAYEIADDGKVTAVIDKHNGKNVLKAQTGAPLAYAVVRNESYPSTSAKWDGQTITIAFGSTGITTRLKPVKHTDYLELEVVDLAGPEAMLMNQMVFVNIEINEPADDDDAFAVTCLALNLQTNSPHIPQPGKDIQAISYGKLVHIGARAAIIGCPKNQMRHILQEAITNAPELPKSSCGGPWAQDDPRTRGSYLFNFNHCTESNVDEWITLAKTLGFNQIDFHGGQSFRFGDCQPNPEFYPNGFASLKAVIDKLHANGIMAGLHTYAFFVAKDSPWVTPEPDPRLRKNGRYTLAKDIAADATTIVVNEPLDGRSTDTGFFMRHSMTIQIGDELIVYTGLSKEKPYAFTGCQRGAHGTTVATYKANDTVHHLDQMFGLFSPDENTDMLEEVAHKTADAYNKCGFDMMYLDALDGQWILSNEGLSWHYGARFVHELVKSVDKAPVMEMSTYYHHIWCVRSRMGAWDHPNFSHKRFIDEHVIANQAATKTFLPGHMGWWAVKTWNGLKCEPTFADDIAYLSQKCIGLDMGMSIMGVDPWSIKSVPALPRLAKIMREHEAVRHAGVDERIKKELAKPGNEFELYENAQSEWKFKRATYDRHKVNGMDGWSDTWTVNNPYAEQKPQLRIEALLSAKPYDSPDAIVLTDFTDIADIETTQDLVKAGEHCGKIVVAPSADPAKLAGSMKWEPGRNLSGHEALGVWVHGDGKGELLNIQLQSPYHISRGIGEHYIDVDFTGWRYFELLEPDSQRWADYKWPYGHPYFIYREEVHYNDIEQLQLWLNNLPANESATCHVSPIKALPLVETTIKHPTIIINGKPLTFQVEMTTGSYLELDGSGTATLFGPNGQTLKQVTPQGDWTPLSTGGNTLGFRCESHENVQPRVRVTVKLLGEDL